MQIGNILTSDRTKAQIHENSKKRVIEKLASIVASSSGDIDADDLFHHLICREKLGTTGIGGGIAIPHCRFATNGKTYGACMTLERPVEFNSIDDKPVDIVFAIIVPENAEKSHLETLACLAEFLQQPAYVNKLRSATNDIELFNAATISH
ncbi:MAG: PTS fructose transporter subunit IIA [Alteromonadaceae bacterium]|nr:MAG: PTS fructose transporter subunit IIA [Alteromonadaceae bacterium]